VVLAEFPNQILIAAHHIRSDPWQIPWTVARAGWYGVSGTPDVFFDGLLEAEGAYQNCTQMANWYRSLINTRLTQTGGVAPVSISGVFSHDASTISLTATFEKLDPVTLANARAYLLVLENNMTYAGRTYNHTTRAAYEQSVTLTNVGDIAVVSTNIAIGGTWNMDNIVAVAWLENHGGTKQIYQAAPLQEGGASVDEPTLAAMNSGVGEITPNPFAPLSQGSSSATIRLRISDQASNQHARLDVLDPSGRMVRNLLDRPLTAGQHTQTWDGLDAAGQPVSAGVYYVRFSNDEQTGSTRLVVLR